MASQLIKTLRVIQGKDPGSPKGENQLQKTVNNLKGRK